MAGNLLRFDDQVVLITGAGRGLGREYALAFADRGAQVVVNDLGSNEKGEGKSSSSADEVVEKITKAGGKAIANYESVENGEELVRQVIEALGRIDILINNAGILRDKSFRKMTTAEWDLVHRVHLRGAFLVTKAAWPHMQKQGYGHIIMISSGTGVFGRYGQANYAAAKIGLYGLCQTLALEGERYNIRCNTILPLADSRLTQGVMADEIRKMLPPKFVAPFLLYLCHKSCAESGKIFYIAGGGAAMLRWQQSGSLNLSSGDKVITPELVRDNWSKLKDWSNASYPKSDQESLSSLLSTAKPPGGGSEMTNASEEFKYTFKDVIRYALGIGVKVKEDGSHMKFLYEGNEDFSVIPTFAVLPAQISLMSNSALSKENVGIDFNPAKAVHGEQYLELYRPIPPNGSLKNEITLVDVLDKKSGAVIIVNSTCSDEKGPICFNQFVTFCIGAGGFGGKSHSNEIKPIVKPPNRPPDVVEIEKTDESQAALYRLSGDFNPLHIDPNFAQIGGFNAPILHGLCFLGIATRAVLKHFCDNNVDLFKAIKARFSKPVIPGQSIRVEMWKGGNNRIFVQCKVVETGDVVLSGAYVDLHSRASTNKDNEKTPLSQTAITSSAQSDIIFQMMSDNLTNHPNLVQKVNASFLWRLTKDGKVVSEWMMDFTKNPGSITHGKPSEKANCTITVTDEDYMKIVMGKTNPQKLFMQGKIKITGNIMLAQKLQSLLKEFDMKKEVEKMKQSSTMLPEKPTVVKKPDLQARGIFDELAKRLVSMPHLSKKIKATYLWKITKDGKTAGQWFLDLKNGSGSITAGEPDEKPDCTITIADGDLVKIMKGKANPQQLFMSGKLKVGGNILLSAKLGELLKSQAKL